MYSVLCMYTRLLCYVSVLSAAGLAWRAGGGGVDGHVGGAVLSFRGVYLIPVTCDGGSQMDEQGSEAV